MSDYITLSDFKLWLGTFPIVPVPSDAMMSFYITKASAILNRNLKRTIPSTSWVEQYDGQGYSFLKVDNWPITTLTQIIEDFNGINPITYVGSNFIYNTEGTIRWSERASNGSFQRGFQNYQVTYVAGYSPVPDDLQAACMMLTRFLLMYATVHPLVGAKRVKDVSINYSRLLAGDFRDPLTADIEQILATYREIECL